MIRTARVQATGTLQEEDQIDGRVGWMLDPRSSSASYFCQYRNRNVDVKHTQRTPTDPDRRMQHQSSLILHRRVNHE